MLVVKLIPVSNRDPRYERIHVVRYRTVCWTGDHWHRRRIASSAKNNFKPSEVFLITQLNQLKINIISIVLITFGVHRTNPAITPPDNNVVVTLKLRYVTLRWRWSLPRWQGPWAPRENDDGMVRKRILRCRLFVKRNHRLPLGFLHNWPTMRDFDIFTGVSPNAHVTSW